MAKTVKNKKKLKIDKFVSKADAIAEARDYLDTARFILDKQAILIVEEGLYKYKKYVRAASAIGYIAALIAIEAYLLGTNNEMLRKKPTSIEEYKTVVNKMSFKNDVMPLLNAVYRALHLDGYYQGAKEFYLIDNGMNHVEKIIDLIEARGK